MNTKIIYFWATLLMFFSVTSMAQPNTQAPNIYTEDKQDILVTANQPQFTIKLKSNPTTGYSWFLREYDASLIQPIKHNFEKPQQNLMGASGSEVWIFKVKPNGFVVPQQTQIRFNYARPWQSTEGGSQVVFRVTTQGK